MAPMGWRYAAAEAALQEPQECKIGMLAPRSEEPISRCVKRALSMARKALEKHGYQVVDVALPNNMWSRAMFFNLAMNFDFQKRLLEDLAETGEKMIESME